MKPNNGSITGDKIAIVGIIVAVAGVAVPIVIPEIRCWLGLNQEPCSKTLCIPFLSPGESCDVSQPNNN
ncbi:MAG: hypothetical protein AB4372_20615 [Xenococcus sp. (in: cyanobacteria)]